ncbi:MAG: hypothetical protein JJE13_00135 [Thermoleophilia bacterium]|nr:hypothetical protein [Thermoleophilia bacterium]
MPFKHDKDLEKREADRAVDEAGGGEAEGFEQSEKELIEQAENFDQGRNPKYDAGKVEAERAGSTYGEADEEHSSEQKDTDR